jgi:hypothetical protein
VYARRQKLSEEAIEYTTEVKVDAKTLMGVMLRAAEKNKGAKWSKVTGSKREPVKDTAPTLADIGISKKESASAQALADLKEKAPALHEKVKAGETTVSKARAELRR